MKSADLDALVEKSLCQLIDETICRQLKLELHNLSIYMLDGLLKENIWHKIEECNERIKILKEEIIKRNIAKGLVIEELNKVES